MDTMASKITSLTIAYSTIYSDADQRKHQSSASLAFVRGIHRGLVNSPHKWPVTRKMFPFDDVIMTLKTQRHVEIIILELTPWPRKFKHTHSFVNTTDCKAFTNVIVHFCACMLSWSSEIRATIQMIHDTHHFILTVPWAVFSIHHSDRIMWALIMEPQQR